MTSEALTDDARVLQQLAAGLAASFPMIPEGPLLRCVLDAAQAVEFLDIVPAERTSLIQRLAIAHLEELRPVSGAKGAYPAPR